MHSTSKLNKKKIAHENRTHYVVSTSTEPVYTYSYVSEKNRTRRFKLFAKDLLGSDVLWDFIDHDNTFDDNKHITLQVTYKKIIRSGRPSFVNMLEIRRGSVDGVYEEYIISHNFIITKGAIKI